MQNHYNMMDELSYWEKKYQKAVKDGVFEDISKPQTTTPLSGNQSFFGPIDTNHPNELDSSDVEIWSKIHGQDAKHESLLKETSEEAKSKLAKSSSAIATAANPIRHSSVGEDQAMMPVQLGVTFTEKELFELADLKLKLHDLGSKLAAFGESAKADKQYLALKQRIDDLSNTLDKSFPHIVDSMGD